ncbi:hypothetical protein [Serratia marcescens]|uniref:hypothetical protein n=1 Tax=Serratia marcescens TaxID=615 RepID=UPI003D7ACAE3
MRDFLGSSSGGRRFGGAVMNVKLTEIKNNVTAWLKIPADGSQITFTGNADEAAKEFFNALIRVRDGYISSLKAERDALADRVNALTVENAAIKAMNDCLSEELRGYESDGAFDGPDMHHLWWKAETPATDAALAAIQAQGVDKLIKLKMEQLANMHPDTHAFGATAESLRSQINELQAFATELREAK